MSISVQCPGCEKNLKTKDELAGKRVKCPACGQVLLVPAAKPVPQLKASNPSQSKAPIVKKAEGVTHPAPRKPPAVNSESVASPAPPSRSGRVRWPWYAGGVAVVLTVVLIGGVSLWPKSGGSPVDPEAIVKKGGKYWLSDYKDVSIGDMKFKPGEQLLFWPTEDKVFQVKDGMLTIPFTWKLRSDQKPASSIISVEYVGTGPGTLFQAHVPINSIVPGATEGTFDLNATFKHWRGEGEILVFMTYAHEPNSNLLRIRVNNP